MRDKNKKYIILLTLLVSIFALTVGYAAMTKTLTIQSSAETAYNWGVSLSKSASSASTGNLSGTPSPSTGGPTAATATLSATTITGAKATFNALNQSVKYTFYARNTGGVKAYLNTVSIGAISCSAASSNGASSAHKDKPCAGITVTVKVGSATYTRTTSNNGSSTSISSHELAAGGNETIEFTISYGNSINYLADGAVNVSIGDTTLIYGPVD